MHGLNLPESYFEDEKDEEEDVENEENSSIDYGFDDVGDKNFEEEEDYEEEEI